MKWLWPDVRRLWVAAVIVPVVAVGAVVIYRFHGVFGSGADAGDVAGGGQITSTAPKYVTYEIYGPADTTGIVSYVDDRLEPREARFTTLPWALTMTTTLPSVYANILAQGDGGELGCRITVNGELRDQRQQRGPSAGTFCVVKAA